MMKEVFEFVNDEDAPNKVKIFREWNDLSEIMDPKKILIPFISKKFLAMSYDVLKVSTKAKLQKRTVKITQESILNMADGKIKSEIFFYNIKEIRKRKPGPEILIRFIHKNDEFGIVSASKKSTLNQSTANALQTIRYVCSNELERDALLDSLMTSAIHEASLSFKQTYKVSKISTKGKKNENRVLKLTSDSILFIGDKVIRTEIPFSSMDAFYVQDRKKDKIHIEYQTGEEKQIYVFVSKESDDIIDSISDAYSRFLFDVKLEHDLFKSTRVEPALTHFYDAFMPQEFTDFDPTLWIEVFLLPAYTEELKSFYSKLKTDSKNMCSLKPETVVDICKKFQIELKDEEITTLLSIWGNSESPTFSFDDVLCGWTYLKRQREVIAKKKKYAAMLKKKTSNRTK
jgi:hypothetical protein